jgi:hypothetical protein
MKALLAAVAALVFVAAAAGISAAHADASHASGMATARVGARA